MTVKDYLRTLRERRLIVILAVLLSLSAAWVTFTMRPATYTARLSMYVSATGAEDAAAAAYGAQLALQRVKSYVVLVSSPRVAQDVIEKLNLPESPDTLSKRISASTPLDSTIIDVEVQDQSPERAAAIANAVAEDFTEVSAELTRNAQIGQSTVALRLVQPAPVPTSPSSPGLFVTLVFGLFTGLVIGVGGALARNAFDSSIRTTERLRAAAAAPVLGVLKYHASTPLMIFNDNPTSPRSDELRKLRTNLQFANTSKPIKLIVLTSSVAGEGTTTTTLNLAHAMSAAGTRVLVLEGDLRRPALAALLQLSRSVGLSNVLAQGVPITEAIQTPSGMTSRRPSPRPRCASPVRFDVLPGGPVPADPSDLLAGESMERLLRDLRGKYDAVLIDAPPLLPYADAPILAAQADGTVLVCRSRAVTQSQVESAAAALRSVSALLLGTVLIEAERKIKLPRRAELQPSPGVANNLGVGGASLNGKPVPPTSDESRQTTTAPIT